MSDDRNRIIDVLPAFWLSCLQLQAYAVSALFGSVVATNICDKKKIGYWVAPFLVSLFFCYFTDLSSSWYMLIAIAVSMLVGRIVYVRKNKGASAQ